MLVNEVLMALLLCGGDYREKEEMKFIKIPLTSSGFSKIGRWPVPKISLNLKLGISSPILLRDSCVMKESSEPEMSKTGNAKFPTVR